MPIPKMRPGQTSFFLSLLLLQHSCNVAASGIQFTTPPGGGTFPAGSFTARWKDAGGSPPLMSDLTVYMLDLIVGGNTPADSRPVQSLSTGSVQQGSANCNISSDVAQSIQNGFYLRMTSNTTDGNTIINYSSRFTVIQMTGSTDPQYIQGASAAVGDTNVPSSQYILHSSPAPSPSAPSSTPSDNPNSSDSDDNHVSLAAIVGVTISISVICTALLIAAGWYLRKRKRKEKEVVQRKSMPPHALGSKAELAADSGSTSPDLELNNRSPVEVDTFGKAEELEGSTVYYELESDWNGWEMSARRSQVQPYDPTR